LSREQQNPREQMVKWRVALLMASLSAGLATLGVTPPNAGERGLVVHEWGTFTSIAGEDGTAVDWRPLAGESDLPSFVYNIADLQNGAGVRVRWHGKQDITARVRMETPVVYFYSDREMTVSVKVGFPKGRITEWYPRADSVRDGIDWGRVKILRDVPMSFPMEKEPSRYYAARETDASPIRVCSEAGNEMEKFLFYRGVGFFDPPLAVTLEGDKVRVKNLGTNRVAELILFERHNGRIAYRIQRSDTGDTVMVRMTESGSLESLFAQVEKILVDHGLYKKEAKAMLKTWRDSWFEEGLRVFYVLPRNTTDAVLPITIDPQPTQLVRVLVGRIEIITPEMESAIRAEIQRLNDPSPDVRAAARTALRKQGRFAEPVVKRLKGGNDDGLVKEIFE